MKQVTENKIKNIEGFVHLPQYDFSDDGNRFTMWNPTEYVFSCESKSEVFEEGRNYTECFEKVKRGIADKGYYSISLRNTANTNGRSKTWRIEIK